MQQQELQEQQAADVGPPQEGRFFGHRPVDEHPPQSLDGSAVAHGGAPDLSDPESGAPFGGNVGGAIQGPSFRREMPFGPSSIPSDHGDFPSTLQLQQPSGGMLTANGSAAAVPFAGYAPHFFNFGGQPGTGGGFPWQFVPVSMMPMPAPDGNMAGVAGLASQDALRKMLELEKERREAEQRILSDQLEEQRRLIESLQLQLGAQSAVGPGAVGRIPDDGRQRGAAFSTNAGGLAKRPAYPLQLTNFNSPPSTQSSPTKTTSPVDPRQQLQPAATRGSWGAVQPRTWDCRDDNRPVSEPDGPPPVRAPQRLPPHVLVLQSMDSSSKFLFPEVHDNGDSGMLNTSLQSETRLVPVSDEGSPGAVRSPPADAPTASIANASPSKSSAAHVVMSPTVRHLGEPVPLDAVSAASTDDEFMTGEESARQPRADQERRVQQPQNAQPAMQTATAAPSVVIPTFGKPVKARPGANKPPLARGNTGPMSSAMPPTALPAAGGGSQMSTPRSMEPSDSAPAAAEAHPPTEAADADVGEELAPQEVMQHTAAPASARLRPVTPVGYGSQTPKTAGRASGEGTVPVRQPTPPPHALQAEVAPPASKPPSPPPPIRAQTPQTPSRFEELEEDDSDPEIDPTAFEADDNGHGTDPHAPLAASVEEQGEEYAGPLPGRTDFHRMSGEDYYSDDGDFETEVDL